MIRSLLGRVFRPGPTSAVAAPEWPRLPPGAVVLFLDFDGVLHRAENGSFEWMGNLDAMAARIPSLAIVLSTNWRINASRDYLLEPFTPSLRGKVCGSTPDLSDGEAFQRQRECVAWAKENAAVRYVAVDDDISLFRPDCEFLFLTDRYVGLDPVTASRLEAFINAQ